MISNVFENLFSVGVPSIDKQHITILNITNNLTDSIVNNRDKIDINEIILELIEYTKTHFKYEEELIDLYPEYMFALAHKEEHKTTLKKIFQIKDKIDAGEAINEVDILWFLREWLVNHILKTDKEFGRFLKSKGVE